MKYFLEYDKKENRHTYILPKEFDSSYEDDNFKYILLDNNLIKSINLTNDLNEFINSKSAEGLQSFDSEGNPTNIISVVSEFKTQKRYKIQRLNELKKLLDNTDYKVIKCYEAQLANEEMPYNLQELLAQRKAWREEINTLEFEISMLA